LPAPGRLSKKLHGVWTAIEAYLVHKKIRCSERTLELEEERISIVKRHFGDVTLRAITAKSIAKYQRTRHEAGISNRTINMDIGVLRPVLKHVGRWHLLEHRVENLPENQKPIGPALTQEEQQRLFEAAASNPA
jgi:site-specific recombinase XerD